MANAKGSVIVGPVKYLRKHREEALALLPLELQRYLELEVRLSSWYPEDDFAGLVRVAAQLISEDPASVIEAMGAAGAHEHTGVYGELMKTLQSSSSLFALWSAQHDTGTLRGIAETPTSSRVQLVGFESPSDVICLLCTGYIRGGLTANGFDNVVVEKPLCVLRGDAHCEWRASWRRPTQATARPGLRRGR